MVKFIIIVQLFLFLSCVSIDTNVLNDGMTKVPSEKNFFDKYYKNKYQIIQIKEKYLNSIYIESFYIDDEGRVFDVRQGSNSFIQGIMFYPNGCINSFSIDKNNLNNISTLNSETNGYRGIIFHREKDSVMHIVCPIDENYRIGIEKKYFKIKNDSLLISSQNNFYSNYHIYIKKELDKKNFSFNANW